jgi:heat shock protein HtpX
LVDDTEKQIRRLTWGYFVALILPLLLLLIVAASTYGIEVPSSEQTFPWLTLFLGVGIVKLIWEASRSDSGNEMLLVLCGARPVEHEDNPQLANIVEEVSIASGRKLPHLYLIDASEPNAFASLDPLRSSFIALTTGLADQLKRSELTAIIAMELASMGRPKPAIGGAVASALAFMTLVLDVVLIVALTAAAFFAVPGSGLPVVGAAARVMLVLGVIAVAIGFLEARIFKFAAFRQDRLLVDFTTARMTGEPESLANALEKIAAAEGSGLPAIQTAGYFVAAPLMKSGGLLHDLTDTYPYVEERIGYLTAMASSSPMAA